MCSFPFSLIAMEIQEEPAQREASSRAANITRYDAEIFSTLKAICESRTSYNDVLSTACTRLVEMKKKGSRFSKSSINSVTEKIRRMGGDYALDHYSAFAGSADNDATDYTLLLSYISDIEHFQDNPVKFQNAVEYLEARLRMHLKKTLLGDDIEELMPVECRESYFISLCLSIMQPYHSDKAYSISTLLSPTRAAERINWGINITEINRRKDESSHLFKLIRRAILNVSSQCNFKVGDTIKKLDESIMTLEGHYRIFNNSIIDITKAKTWMLDRKGEFSEFYDAIAEGTSNFYNSSDLKSLQKIYGAFIDASKIEQSDLTTTPYWAQLEQIHTAINDAIEERSNERRLIYDVYASRGHICFDATDPRNETLKMQASTIEDEVKASKKNHHASNKKAKAKKLKERRRNNKAALKSATSAISEETPDSLSPLNILFSTAQDTRPAA